MSCRRQIWRVTYRYNRYRSSNLLAAVFHYPAVLWDYGSRNFFFCWIHFLSLRWKFVNMELWWKVEREKPKYFEINLSFYHFFVHRSHVDCPGGEPMSRSPQWEAGDSSAEMLHDLHLVYSGMRFTLNSRRGCGLGADFRQEPDMIFSKTAKPEVGATQPQWVPKGGWVCFSEGKVAEAWRIQLNSVYCKS